MLTTTSLFWQWPHYEWISVLHIHRCSISDGACCTGSVVQPSSWLDVNDSHVWVEAHSVETGESPRLPQLPWRLQFLTESSLLIQHLHCTHQCVLCLSTPHSFNNWCNSKRRKREVIDQFLHKGDHSINPDRFAISTTCLDCFRKRWNGSCRELHKRAWCWPCSRCDVRRNERPCGSCPFHWQLQHWIARSTIDGVRRNEGLNFLTAEINGLLRLWFSTRLAAEQNGHTLTCCCPHPYTFEL